MALLLAFLLLSGTSYGRALAAPGNATWQDRTAGWVRDHGGGGAVDAIENWYYTRHEPSTGAPAPGALPAGTTTLSRPAQLPTLPGPSSLPGEGRWVPGRAGPGGAAASYTSYFQPDPQHASVIAGVAWIPAGATTAHLVAGTQQPGGGGWAGNAQVTPADVPNLVATFNSGWKLQDITGGYYAQGRTVHTLQDGQASLVIDSSGAITVGAWGRDVSLTPQVVAVRQNLALVVDGGAPVAGLSTNLDGSWGSSKNQLQYTWRSGIGVDAAGNVVYFAGNGMTLSTLAIALADAGAVRGMQLDIHGGMAIYASWAPSGGSVTPTKLLPDMPSDAQRYLAPDQRDFLYLTLP